MRLSNPRAGAHVNEGVALKDVSPGGIPAHDDLLRIHSQVQLHHRSVIVNVERDLRRDGLPAVGTELPRQKSCSDKLPARTRVDMCDARRVDLVCWQDDRPWVFRLATRLPAILAVRHRK